MFKVLDSYTLNTGEAPFYVAACSFLLFDSMVKNLTACTLPPRKVSLRK